MQHMFQPEASNSGRRRLYATRACNECRRRRCKCDGEQPTCGTCAISGHECSWNADTEASRPFTKQYIESLRVKVKSLESQIAQLQTRPSTISADLSPSPSTFSQSTLGEVRAPPPLLNGVFDPFSPTSLPVNLGFLPSLFPSGLHTPPSPSAFQYQYIFNINLSIPFEQQTPEAQASLSCQWNRHLPDLGQVNLSRIEHDKILSRYFNSGASWLFGVVPSLFLRDMIRSLSQQTASTTADLSIPNYSPLIHCALLAFASIFSEDPSFRANEIRVKFATQAKDWVFDQFNDFHPTLLPALALLAEYHNGMGERNTGYMYLGMGMRAVKAAPNQANISSHTWYSWSVFAQEAFSALGSGRPNQMPPPVIPIDYSTEHSRDYSSVEAETFVRSCKLAVIATQINKNRRSDSSGFANLQLQLDAWYNSLPHGSLVRQRASFMHPHVLCLHIGYWWILLRIHFPLYRRSQSNNSSIGSDEDQSVNMCNRATENLVQLFAEFDARYTLRYFPENLLQAITLCGDTLLLERNRSPDSAPEKREKVEEGINLCIRSLRAVGETWTYALSLVAEFQARVAG